MIQSVQWGMGSQLEVEKTAVIKLVQKFQLYVLCLLGNAVPHLKGLIMDIVE